MMDIFFSEDELLRALQVLESATSAGRLDWSTRSGNEYQLGAAVGDFVVAITSKDSDDLPPYRLLIADATGRVLEQSHSVSEPDETDVELNVALDSLYRAAKRRALGIEEAKKSFLDELSKLDDQPGLL